MYLQIEKYHINDDYIIQKEIENELNKTMPGFLLDPDEMEKEILKYKAKNNGILPKIRKKYENYDPWKFNNTIIDCKKEDEITKEKLLERMGFKQLKMSDSEKKELYEKTISYIKIKYDKILEERLVLGLSNIDDSFKWFKALIDLVNDDLYPPEESLWYKLYGYDIRR